MSKESEPPLRPRRAQRCVGVGVTQDHHGSTCTGDRRPTVRQRITFRVSAIHRAHVRGVQRVQRRAAAQRQGGLVFHGTRSTDTDADFRDVLVSSVAVTVIVADFGVNNPRDQTRIRRCMPSRIRRDECPHPSALDVNEPGSNPPTPDNVTGPPSGSEATAVIFAVPVDEFVTVALAATVGAWFARDDHRHLRRPTMAVIDRHVEPNPNR